MDDARVDGATVPRAADGRVPGRRGRATRRRLLDETRAAVADVPYREVKVVDISRRAGTSPATFYQYFPDIEAAVLTLAEEMVEAGSRLLRELVTEPAWDGPAAARGLADGFIDFFAEHEPVLRVVDLATSEGDERFRRLRLRLLNGVFLAIRSLAEDAKDAGRLDPDADPGAIASVVTTMLAHVSAHAKGYEAWGVARDALASTMATTIDRAVRNGAANH